MKISAPIASRPKVNFMTVKKSFTAPCMPSTPKPPRKNILPLMPTLRLTTSDMNIMPVMMPRPPIWISDRSTSCETMPVSLETSITLSPVTHTADVAMKSASTGVIGMSWTKLLESHKRKAPANITSRKPMTITLSTL